MFYKIYRTEAGRVQEDLFMNKESYLFDRIRWGAAIFLIFHISLLFILFLQDWKTEKMKWFILFLGVLYVILLYAAYQLIYRPLKVNSRIKAAFARGDSYEDIYHMPYLLNEEEQNMLRRFYALLDKSELITVSKKKSEYLALQNQINPHFLYNTLEGIRAEALIAGVDSIAEMTEALATYFRYTISQVNNLVTLEEELANGKHTQEEIKAIQKKDDAKMTVYIFTCLMAEEKTRARQALKDWKGSKTPRNVMLKTGLRVASIMPPSIKNMAYQIRLKIY